MRKRRLPAMSLNGSCTMTVDQIVDLVKQAYTQVQLIPSTGVWGFSKHYASATGALVKAFGQFPQVTDQDWINGFDLGFEQGRQYNKDFDLLTYGNTRQFVEGFKVGTEVAIQIFAWPDAPNVNSQNLHAGHYPQDGYSSPYP